MSTPSNTIAFIGLGVMGYPMALNLRKRLPPTTTLLIADLSSSAISSFQAATTSYGPVERVSSGYAAIQRADTVITMLPDSAAVEQVYLDGESGILRGAEELVSKEEGGDGEGEGEGEKSDRKRKRIIECGTIETATILQVAQATHKSRASHLLTFVDAPVSGGPMGAQAATLTFMVGMDADARDASFPTVQTTLSHMGKADSIFLCGALGAGTAFKIINNYLSAITSLAASEALNIGAKMGLDLKLLTDVINVSGGQCWVTSKANPVPGVQEGVPSSCGYEGGFRIELCEKVLGMGSRLAEEVGARTVLDGPALGAFGEAGGDERYRGKDARVVYKWLNESERRK